MSCFVSHRDDSDLLVNDTSNEDGVTYYSVIVRVGNINWKVKHRYSDFVRLHTYLVSDHGLARDLLPPKKAIGNKTAKFVEQRREALDVYLKSVFTYLKLSMPTVFAQFLDFHVYDIFFALQVLAKMFFLDGDKLLQNNKSYKFTPFQVSKQVGFRLW